MFEFSLFRFCLVDEPFIYKNSYKKHVKRPSSKNATIGINMLPSPPYCQGIKICLKNIRQGK